VAQEPRPRVAVIGIGQSDRALRRPDVDYAELAQEAVSRALADAGLRLTQIDHAVTASLDFVDGRTISSMSVAEVVGSFLKPEARLCGDGNAAMLYALAKMWTGEYRYCLVLAHAKESQGRHSDIESAAFDPFFERRLGPDGDVIAGLAAQQWYARSGHGPESAAEAVVAAGVAGRGHPTAVGDPVPDVRSVLTSPLLAEPLRVGDKARRSDGAAALVLAIEDAVPDGIAPVTVVGGATRTDAYWRDRDLTATDALDSALAETLRAIGWDAGPDVVEFSAQYGFRHLQYAERLRVHGTPVLNPSGGWLAGGAQVVTGLDRLIDVVRQLRGTAGDRQIAGARRGLSHGVHGLADQTHTVVALEGASA
jgi:acetyl-CoA C-acetyltransferase